MSVLRLASAAAVLALTSAAFAQDDPAGLVELDDDQVLIIQTAVSVEELEEMDVATADGDEIGEVEEVLGGADGEPIGLAIEAGGFLGVGEQDIIVEFQDVVIHDDEIILDMTREEIEALTEWDG